MTTLEGTRRGRRQFLLDLPPSLQRFVTANIVKRDGDDEGNDARMTTVQRFNFKTEEVSIISKTWESVAKQRRERERERESEARSFLSFGANHQQKAKK